MATETVGSPVTINILRSEDDTNDIVCSLTNEDGTAATVAGWTAVLNIGSDAATPLSPAQTYNGVGVSNGKIPINMNGFNCPVGSYKYDIRITDTVTGDTPARVYFKGSFKVVDRIE